MPERNYWLDLFTYETWDEFLATGCTVSGFGFRQWKLLDRTRPGDYLLCYMTGLSRFIAILEITGPPFVDNARPRKPADLSHGLPVTVVTRLEPDTAVPMADLAPSLSFYRHANPRAYVGHVRVSLRRWEPVDADVVVSAVLEATHNPVHHPVDPRRLKYIPRGLQGQLA